MAKRGRPTKFKKELIKDAEQLAGLGFTEENFATYWEISPETLRRWKRKNPDLSGAIEKGKLRANISVTKSLFNNAKEGNLSAQIFWLTNRTDTWKDRRALVNNKIVNSNTNNNYDTSSFEKREQEAREKLHRYFPVS